MATVAVIGAGLLGRGIAAVVAKAGHCVILHDSNESVLDTAHRHVTNSSPAAVVAVQATLDRAVALADIVIEAVLEDLTLKQEIFHRIGDCNSSAILMSNSSVLPISEIAARTNLPERAVGTHWWNPPHLIPVVEVIRGGATSERVMQRTCEFLTGLGKTAVRVERDVPGFVGNRLQHALWREALALLNEEACSAHEVDRIVSSTLGRWLAVRGPFEEMLLRGREEVRSDFAAVLAQINSEPTPAPLLTRKVARGQMGAKSGVGFLKWPPDAREFAAQRLQSHVERRLQQEYVPGADANVILSKADEPIARRLRVALWREAISLVENHVCDAHTVDLMAKKTIGLRLEVMAPVENADFVGLDLTLAIHRAVLPSLNAGQVMPAWLNDR